MRLLSRETFPASSGALGASMRDMDWSASPIGDPAAWPASLKTAVGLMLPAQAQIVLFWGRDFVALYNDAYAPTIGDKHPHALGRPAREYWAELWDDLEPLLRSVRETGETFHARDRPFYIERHGYGEEVFFDISYSAVPDETGEVGGVLCIVSETTARVLVEQRQAFLLRLGDALRPVEDPAEAQSLAARLLSEELGLDRCGYGEVDASGTLITIQHDYAAQGMPNFAGRHRLSDFGAGIVDPLRRGETLVVDEIAAHPAAADAKVAQSFAAARIGATVGAPLIKNGQFAAVLFAHQRSTRRWTASDVALIQDVAERTWAAVEKGRAETAKRAVQHELQTLADTLPVLISYVDADRRYQFVNQVYEVWFPSRRKEAVVGLHVREVIGEAAYAAVLPYMNRVLAGEIASFDQFLPYAEGAPRYVHVDYVPRWGDGGRVIGFYALINDVSEAKRAADQLRESEERLRLATDAAELGFWDVDVVHEQLIWPVRVKNMFGIWSDRPVTMDDFYGGLHPDDRAATTEAFARACDPNERALYDVDYRTVGAEDGVIRWVAAKGRAVFDESGRCLRVIGTAIDISRRKAAETALRDSESRLRFLGELDDALRRVRDPAEAMAAATRLLAERLDASRCAYADVDPDNDRFVIRADYSAPGMESSAGEYSLDLFGPRAAADMRDGRTLVVRDVPGELAPGEGREMFQAIGIDAIICCPLVKDGRLRAMMAMHNVTARDWRPDEIALVETVVERCWSQIERVGAEARLRDSEERYRTLFTTIESGFCVVEVQLDRPDGRADYRVVEANPAFYQQTGFAEAVFGQWLREAAPDLEDYWFETYGRIARTGAPERFEQGSTALGRWFDVYAFRVGEPEERRVAILFNDISARRNAEESLRELNDTLEQRVVDRTAELEAAHEQLRQSQKMEAMGQLTGGVAHDFNNLLTPIVGALDLLQRKELGGAREQRLIGGAAQSADRAKTLVQRLLAFARRQPLQMVPVHVPELVRGMADLIASTTGPQIKVVVNVEDGLPLAKADPNQLEMALLNLSVNARDAMPDGGTLRISATAAHAGRDEVPGLAGGDYVCLSVADTGVGMNAETLKRAVEPFFSTKGIGRGTGLGLSMVHGLASQLGGALNITSRPGIGTNIELWLPQTEDRLARADAPVEVDATPRRGSVLLVDDEELVRISTADMLEDMGFRVVEAASSEEALRFLQRGDPIDLLVTDHLMPGMTGSELAHRARQMLGKLPVLVVSGYAESDGLAPDLPRLTKPFRKDDLAASVAGVLAAS